MNSPHEGPALGELLAGFAACLRASSDRADADLAEDFAAAVVDDGIAPVARLRVYRNNSRAVFEDALRRTYPVVCRRVGEDFFLQLTREYRLEHPSRSGDLHAVGAKFPDWLARRMADTGYDWLADVARLEWTCEEVLVAEDAPAATLEVLRDVDPQQLAATGLHLVPSARCVESCFPIWSVWQENQAERPGAPVDLASGPQYVIVQCGGEGLVLHSVPPADFAFVRSLARGQPLAVALETAELQVAQLPQVLGWLFREGLVAGLRPPAMGTPL